MTSQLNEVIQKAWRVPLEEEMKKDPAIKQAAINDVLDWCRKQPYLPPVSEHTVALFLKLSHYDVEKTCMYINNHYTFRTYYRCIFSERDPELNAVKQIMSAIRMAVLPGKTAEGRRVLFGMLRSSDSSVFNAPRAVKFAYMTLERDIVCNGFGDVSSYSLLFDAKGFGLGHLSSISLSFIKQVLSYFLDGANMAILEINLLNVNPVVEKIVHIIKGLAPKEVYERIKMYSKDKTASCLAKFPREMLPQELGGTAKLLLQEMSDLNEKQVIDFRQWYLADETLLRVDEAKRPAGDQNKKVVKLQASIKKLELD